MCRRDLYEKYLERRDDWAEGLTATGKQILLDVQRKKTYKSQQRAQTAPMYIRVKSTAATSRQRPATAILISSTTSNRSPMLSENTVNFS